MQAVTVFLRRASGITLGPKNLEILLRNIGRTLPIKGNPRTTKTTLDYIGGWRSRSSDRLGRWRINQRVIVP